MNNERQFINPWDRIKILESIISGDADLLQTSLEMLEEIKMDENMLTHKQVSKKHAIQRDIRSRLNWSTTVSNNA